MKKKLLLTVAVIMALFTMTVSASETVTAIYNSSKVIVDNTEVAFEAYNIDGSNYFKLRDIAYTFSPTDAQFSPYYGFDIKWDAEQNAINIIRTYEWDESTYTAAGGEMELGDGTNKNAVLSTASVLLNGEPIELTAYNINGNNYFKLRDLAKALDFAVDWDAESNSVIVYTYFSQEEYDDIKSSGWF